MIEKNELKKGTYAKPKLKKHGDLSEITLAKHDVGGDKDSMLS